MQNSVISPRVPSLYGYQPTSVVFGCKTARFAPELHASVGPRPHLLFCACKTACLALEILVSMSPSPHLLSLIAKQRLLVQNCKSLWVPDLTCRFVNAKQRVSTRITSLYGSQIPPVVFACKTTSFGPELQVSMGPSPHLSFCACKTA